MDINVDVSKIFYYFSIFFFNFLRWNLEIIRIFWVILADFPFMEVDFFLEIPFYVARDVP